MLIHCNLERVITLQTCRLGHTESKNFLLQHSMGSKKVIEELKDVVTNTEDINFGVIELCSIVGVNNVVHLVQCVKCFKKIVCNDESVLLAHCYECNTMQRVDSDNKTLTAELIVKDLKTENLHVLRASHEIIATIIGNIPQSAEIDDIQKLLLKEYVLQLNYSDAIITSVKVQHK